MARNAHKSVLAGLVQVGARPVWLEPRWDDRFGVAHGLDADVVEGGFADSGAKALWVLHPTYYGTTGDIAALSQLCRRHDATLLVDGAHSPHFAFHPELPTPGEKAGAAATVQSIHKILSGLSQAAVLHIDPAVLDPASVRRALQLIQTTSPHFAIMGRSISPGARWCSAADGFSSRRSSGRGAPRPGWRPSRACTCCGRSILPAQAPGCTNSTRPSYYRNRRSGGAGPRHRGTAQPGARCAAGAEWHRPCSVHHHDRQLRQRF